MAFPWTEQTELAAMLLAQRNLGVEAIAEKVGVDRRTIYNWRQNPEFKARVESLVADFREEARRIGIANVDRRVAHQAHRHSLLAKLISDRADAPGMDDVPGGRTGLLVRKVRKVVVEDDEDGKPRSTEVTEYQLDAALLKAMLELEREVAVELGQRQAGVEGGAADIRQAAADTEAAGEGYQEDEDPDE